MLDKNGLIICAQIYLKHPLRYICCGYNYN
jgi:hypothetical protein